MRTPLRLAAVAAALGLAACGSEPTTSAGELRSDAPAFAASANGSSGRHIVAFSTYAVPGDFEARITALGGSVERSWGPVGLAVVSGLSDAAAGKLVGAGNVSSVIADPDVTLEQPVAVDAAAALEAGIESPAAPATAFFFPRQWNMRQVRADQAWAAGRLGSSNVRVAILDTGLDYTHADLAGRVDLTYSKSFIPGDAALIAANFPGAHEIADLHFHGTHVGATVSSNAIAAAGVTSQVTLVGVKVLAANGSSVGSSVLDGIMYAATPIAEGGAGADVINMSLGSRFGVSKRDFPGFVADINRVMNYAKSKGVTVVVSAGNSALDLDHDGDGYKTYCNTVNVICVAATGPTAQAGVNGPWTNIDASSSYTNFGRSVINVAAPGGNAATFVYAACSRFSLQVPVCGTGTFVLGVQGTSQASPHVAGLAALLVEDLGREPGAIRGRIQSSADDIGQPGTDPFYGKGRINVARGLGL